MFDKIKAWWNEPKPIWFQNHNLVNWDYLGYVRMSWIDSEGKATQGTDVYFFQKKDLSERSFFYSRRDAFRGHKFLRFCGLWKIEEKNTRAIPFTEPSKFMKNHMAEQHGLEWGGDREFWIEPKSPNHKKYEAALKKQQESKSNVIKLSLVNDNEN